jgi:hypothetical protein
MAFLEGYTKRKQLTISHAQIDELLTDFRLAVQITADSDVGAAALSTGYDIRFTAADGTTLLPHERESFAISDGAATGLFWVKVPSLAADADTVIYLYYGDASAADASSPSSTWGTTDYKLVYHLRDDPNNSYQVLDSSGNGNTGLKTTSDYQLPQEVDGKIAQGQQCDGWSNYLYSTSSVGLSGDSDRTMEIWAKVGSYTGPGGILAWGATTGPAFEHAYMCALVASVASYDRFAFWDWLVDGIVSDVPSADNAWHYLAVTHSATTTRLYVDGVLKYTQTETLETVDTPAYIGYEPGLGSHVAGSFDEARIHAVARSDAWIKFAYHNMNAAGGEITTGSEEVGAGFTGEGWSYRKPVTISHAHVDEDLTNVPVLVEFVGDAQIGAAALSTGHDIRFTAADGTTLLSYEREGFLVSGGLATGRFWVRIPTLTSAADTTLYLYYGNAAAGNVSSAGPWSNGFKVVYHLKNNPSDSSQVFDSTSSGNTLTKQATSTEVTAIVGEGQETSSNGYLTSTANIGISGSSPRTLELWVKVAAAQTATGPSGILGWGSSTYDLRLCYLTCAVGSSTTFSVWTFGFPTTDGDIASDIPSVDNQWHHVAMTYDGTNLCLFVDGAIKGASAVTLATDDGPLQLGRTIPYESFVTGLFDEARVHSVARSAAWLKFSYHNTKAGTRDISWGAQESTGGATAEVAASSETLTGYAATVGSTVEAGQASHMLQALAATQATLSDPATAGDTIVRQAAFPREGDDAAQAADALGTQASRLGSLPETAQARDVATAQAAAGVDASDAANAAELLTIEWAHIVATTASDIGTASEALAGTVTSQVAISEAGAASEAIAPQGSMHATVEATAAVAETLVLQAAKLGLLTEAAQANDLANGRAVATASASAAASADELLSVVATGIVAAVVNDSGAASETIVAAAASRASMNDLATASESLESVATHRATTTEALAATDQATATAQRLAGVADPSCTTDSLGGLAVAAGATLDAAMGSDSTSGHADAMANRSEVAIASDSFACQASGAAEIADAAVGAESSAISGHFRGQPIDAAMAAGSFSGHRNAASDLTDAAAAAELITVHVDFRSDQNDDAIIAQAFVALANAKPHLTETVSARDSASARAETWVERTEGAMAAETFADAMDAMVVVADATAGVESFGVHLAALTISTDAGRTAESLRGPAAARGTLAESATTRDARTGHADALSAAADEADATDDATAKLITGTGAYTCRVSLDHALAVSVSCQPVVGRGRVTLGHALAAIASCEPAIGRGRVTLTTALSMTMEVSAP